MSQDRWASFACEELEAIKDGLLTEASIDPREDPSFPRRIAIAERMISEIDAEIDAHLETL